MKSESKDSPKPQLNLAAGKVDVAHFINRALDQDNARNLAGAVLQCHKLLDRSQNLPNDTIEKLEFILNSNKANHQTVHLEVCKLLVKIAQSPGYRIFSEPTILVFSQDIGNPAIDLTFRQELVLTLTLLVKKGHNLANNQEVINNLQKQSEANESILSEQIKITLKLVEELFNQDKEVEEKEEDKEIKDLKSLLNETEKLNCHNPEVIKLIKEGVFEQQLALINEFYENNSIVAPQGTNINQWARQEIGIWAEKIKQNKTLAHDKKIFSEMLAVIKRAHFLKTIEDTEEGSGYEVRTIQLISLLTLFESNDQGRLLQIATGEGKSTTTAMMAVVKVLQGDKVDIVTSSSLLAIRDAVSWQSFFSMFNISVSHNIQKDYVKGQKDCYLADVVYGDAHNFQSDILRDEYKGLGTRGGRQFSATSVIIDEVDSMLIDESTKIAKLSSPIPAMEYLEPLFIAGWHQLQQFVNYFTEQKTESGLEENALKIEQSLTEYIQSLITSDGENSKGERIVLPKHLENFAFQQASKWAKAAVTAQTMDEKRDYLIIKGSDGYEIIAPVDYASTGIIQEKTSWVDGLHQFLQVKHCLKMSAESLSTSFISNMSYFKRYGNKISGMTGTLGSEDSQNLLKETYDVDIVLIPTFKVRQFEELPGIIKDDENEWLAAVSDSATTEAARGRAVLVICETIEDAENIEQLIKGNYSESKIKLYTKSNDNESETLESKVTPGDVIVATNLAGRGTDIKTSTEVEAAGGLHVCLSFLPSNLRVEQQAFGRTAREGHKGSGQLIINGMYERIKLSKVTGLQKVETVAQFKNWRDITETARLKEVKEKKLEKIATDDELFNRFNHLFQELKAKEDNECKLAQVEEKWGLWLNSINEEKGDNSSSLFQRFAAFKAEIVQAYSNGNNIIENPVYLTRAADNLLGVGSKGYDDSINLLEIAIKLDPVYSYAARYNLAYAYLRRNYEGKKKIISPVDAATENLLACYNQLQEYNIPQFK